MTSATALKAASVPDAVAEHREAMCFKAWFASLLASSMAASRAPFSSLTLGIAFGSLCARRERLKVLAVHKYGMALADHGAPESEAAISNGISSAARDGCLSTTFLTAATTMATLSSSAAACTNSFLQRLAHSSLAGTVSRSEHRVSKASLLASSPTRAASTPTRCTALRNEVCSAIFLRCAGPSKMFSSVSPASGFTARKAVSAVASSGLICLGANFGTRLLAVAPSAMSAKSLKKTTPLSGRRPFPSPSQASARFVKVDVVTAHTRSKSTECAEAMESNNFLAPLRANDAESSAASVAAPCKVGSTSFANQ
mmetsp:Transcript_39541/g.93056  ORF Transcript_39541/g.93056 Transcript_39541/m.93056 type:complete len:313 (+) Transcript_39541:68-1006(+)